MFLSTDESCLTLSAAPSSTTLSVVRDKIGKDKEEGGKNVSGEVSTSGGMLSKRSNMLMSLTIIML